MSRSVPVDVPFAIAVLALEGVGRVTAHRLLSRFPTYPSLLSCPREQVLIRLKGAPHADRTIATLFDQRLFAEALASASSNVAELERKEIRVLASGHPHWPTGLEDLERTNRPVVLYTFGTTDALARVSVALHARPPMAEHAFESAQALARALADERIPISCGARSGFDVVIHKLCAAAASPCVMIAPMGLAKVDGKMRPSIATCVRKGGVLVSPFPPTHGPFEHDETEGILLQAALSGPNVFIAPRLHEPESRILAWALKTNRPIFGIPGRGDDDLFPLPDRVHELTRAIDYDWVLAAARGSDRS